MRIPLKWAVALTMALALAVAAVVPQYSSSDSTPSSGQSEGPVDQNAALPVTRVEILRDKDAGAEPKVIEAPAPGVPVDEQTYRELKERAKKAR